jgi:hypothetical protein
MTFDDVWLGQLRSVTIPNQMAHMEEIMEVVTLWSLCWSLLFRTLPHYLWRGICVAYDMFPSPQLRQAVRFSICAIDYSEIGGEVLTSTLCYLCLVPCNFHLFTRLKGKYFSSDNEIYLVTTIACWNITSGGNSHLTNEWTIGRGVCVHWEYSVAGQ